MLGILSIIVGVVSFVCFIMVEIKIFQDGKVLIGVLGILTCGILTLIYGWMNADRYRIKNLMIIYTVAVLLNIALTSYVRISTPTTTVTYPGGTTVTH